MPVHLPAGGFRSLLHPRVQDVPATLTPARVF